MRRRARAHEPANDLHAELLAKLAGGDSRFWDRDVRPVADVDFGADLEAQIDLSRALRTHGPGYVSYVFRSKDYIRDTAEFDDRLVVQLRSSEDLLDFVCELVEAFGPYRATVEFDEDLCLDDWEDAVAAGRTSGRDEDGRDGVWRIAPLAFYDAELCMRAFGFGADVLYERLRAVGVGVSLVRDGALIDGGEGPWEESSLVEFDARCRAAIGVGRPDD